MKMVRGARNFLCAPSKFVFGGWSCSLASKNFVDRVFSFEIKANVLRTRRLHSDTTDVRYPLIFVESSSVWPKKYVARQHRHLGIPKTYTIKTMCRSMIKHIGLQRWDWKLWGSCVQDGQTANQI